MIPHTDQDFQDSGNEVWVATSGGVFSYAPETGSIQSFTVVDGLASVATSSITADPSRAQVWVGYSDGTLNSIGEDTGVIQTFRDIQRADQFSDRGINEIVVHGDSLFIATAFGMVVFDPVRKEVIDSYSRLGNLPAASDVRDVLIDSSVEGVATLWAATESGVARAPLNGTNLQDPANWVMESQGLNGLGESVLSLQALGGQLYVGTGQDLYRRDATGRYNRMQLTSRPVPSLSGSPSRIVGTAEFRVLVVNEDGSTRSLAAPGLSFPTDIETTVSGALWI